jgi:hypothetical protein
MRTTIDLDPAVLRELKARQQREGKSLGRLASELLAAALSQSSTSSTSADFTWTTAPMGARIDLEDKDALHVALDEQHQ